MCMTFTTTIKTQSRGDKQLNKTDEINNINPGKPRESSGLGLISARSPETEMQSLVEPTEKTGPSNMCQPTIINVQRLVGTKDFLKILCLCSKTKGKENGLPCPDLD